MPRHRSWMAPLAAVALAGGVAWSALPAQGVTTGAIGGTVTDTAGTPLGAVQIQIVNRQTGFSTGTITRENGRYLVQGLEVGGPYAVTARRIGFTPRTVDTITVALSVIRRLDFRLATQAAQLTGVTVTASPVADISPANVGTKTVITDTVIQRVPNLSRNLVDFIRLTPQVSTSGPGYSAGGMSNRMNNVQIDGATERDVFGLGSTGQPGGQVSAKAISIEAIKELQVLLAPYDVRQGNFGGLLLNAVTKSGTNDFHGSGLYQYRNQDYGRDVPALRATPFLRKQGAFSLGGPIVRDKILFFTANEFTRETTPVSGPYFNQPANTTPVFPIAAADLARFESIMKSKYNFDPGNPGALQSPQPMTNLFGRIDDQLSDVHRLVVRYNYTNTTKQNRAQNGRSSSTAVYSSNEHNIHHVKNAPVVQLFSNFANGTSNELFLGADWVQDRRTPNGLFPQVTINNATGTNRIISGADQFSQGNQLDAYTYELTDNFTLPRGAHTLVLGTRNELVKVRNQFTQSSYGVWSFRNLDSLEAGNANSFRKSIILAQEGNVYFDALQTALYAQDEWAATPTFSVRLGARADISNFLTANSYNPAIDSAYGPHRTPRSSVQFSPRVGFNWDVGGNQVNQLRGGVGLFVGTPPYVWLENAYVNNGRIITFLNCNTSGSTAPAPRFQVDPSGINTCANGQGSKPIGDVNFLDAGLKFPQPLRANLAFDRVLPGGLVATVEGMYSKTLNQFFFVNRNLAGPQGTDAHGRVLYGSIATTGRSTAVVPPAVASNGGTARFSTAIDLTNQNKDYSYNVTGQLRKRYSHNWEALVAYTYGHAYDVQSFTSSTHISNWQFGRTLAGRQEDPYLTTSLFDQPHKITATASYTLNWLKRFATDFTAVYTGVSGGPHDYVYGGSGGAGDLNADGVQGNDLLYVPRSATDPAEIQFRTTNFVNPSGTSVSVTAAEQAAAFEQLVNSSTCLSTYRGQIIPRNACRQPFTHNVDVSVRQAIPTIAGQRFTLQFDVFNFGNLLNKNWGKNPVTPQTLNSNVPLVTHVGMTSTDPRTAVPIVTYNVFTFDPDRSGNPNEYQASTNFAGNFWRTQIALRYSF